MAIEPMGLGTLYPPPGVVWNEPTYMTVNSLPGCLLATAPLPKEGVKRKLFNAKDGSDESSHVFPVPFISASLHSLDLWITPAHTEAVRFRAGRLTAAPHPPITQDARAVEITPFQGWFQYKTRHRKWHRLVKMLTCGVTTREQTATNPKICNRLNCHLK